MRIEYQNAFILHTRPFRDTSLMVDLFSEEYGIIRGIARGVKKGKPEMRGLLQPFIPVAISLSGKTDLFSINAIEARGLAYALHGRTTLCGFYLNELLIKLLHVHDPHPNLFSGYAQVLENLQNTDARAQQRALRTFERLLLKEIGYALRLDQDANGNAIEKQFKYFYKFGTGLINIAAGYISAADNVISGATLIALNLGQLVTDQEYHESKLLLRQVINSLLEKPLKSRELW